MDNARPKFTADDLINISLGTIFILLGIVATPWINLWQLAGPAWYLQSILAILIGVLFVRASLVR